MIERTADADWIKSIATHERVWPWISEDEDRPENYEPDFHKTVYLKTSESGYVSFRPFTRACWEIHVCMLPKPVKPEIQAAQAMAWMADRGICLFLAKIPSPNRHAIALAEKCGFSHVGRVRKSCMRRGRLVDMVLMEFGNG